MYTEIINNIENKNYLEVSNLMMTLKNTRNALSG